MIKRIWKKSSLFPISIGIVTGIIILACGDFGGDEFTHSFFPPEITHEEKYAEFFYTPDPLYVSTRKSSYLEDFNEVNIEEWGSYFQKQVKDKDLEYILYKARAGEIDTLIFSIKKSGWYPTGNELKSNTVLKIKDTRTALDFLYYVGYAKRCEKYGTYEYQYWYDDRDKDKDPRKDISGMNALVAGGLKQMTNPKSDFIKQRYVFQLLRLYYISKQYDNCIQFYTKQKTLLETNSNSMKYRTMGYAAGAYYGLKQFGMANYLYSVIYSDNDIMRVSAYFSFHPQEEKDWNQTLAMAKSPKEKAVLWQMLGIYHDSFRSLKEIYAIDPKSDLLSMLLTRSINIDEGNFVFGPGELTMQENPDSTTNLTGMKGDQELFRFVKEVAGKENTTKPYEWNLAAGYLAWTNRDKSFAAYLSKAKSEAVGDTLVWEECKLIGLLDKIDNGKAGNRKFEESIVPELIWLEVAKHPEHFPRDFARQYIFDELSDKYLLIGDSVKYTCFSCANNKPIIQKLSLLNKMEQFIDKNNKTTFDQYALNQLPYSKKDIVEIQAVNLLYKFRFKDALAKLNEADSAGNEPPYGDPFQVHINDCHDCDNNGYSLYSADEFGDTNMPEVNNRKDFIQAMVDLEGKIKSDPLHKAHTYFLLANGYYNMSYFGNNRSFYDTKATYMQYAGFDYKYYSNDTINDPWPFYMDCGKAMDYYLKAMNASNSSEFKAKCCFMAAKCEQNYFYTHRPKDFKGDFRAGKYFGILKANYSNTEYYKEIIKECGYFSKYANSNR